MKRGHHNGCACRFDVVERGTRGLRGRVEREQTVRRAQRANFVVEGGRGSTTGGSRRMRGGGATNREGVAAAGKPEQPTSYAMKETVGQRSERLAL